MGEGGGGENKQQNSSLLVSEYVGGRSRVIELPCYSNAVSLNMVYNTLALKVVAIAKGML